MAGRGTRGQPGEGRGPAGAEQPGQHGSGHGLRAGADEHAVPGPPRGRGDGQQAGTGPLGCVDPAYAEGGQLAAQHLLLLAGVVLAQVPGQDQRYRHAVLPAAQAAVTSA